MQIKEARDGARGPGDLGLRGPERSVDIELSSPGKSSYILFNCNSSMSVSGFTLISMLQVIYHPGRTCCRYGKRTTQRSVPAR